MRRFILVAFSLFIALTACNTAKGDIEGFTDIVAQINQHPNQYDGQSVVIVGYFRGQDLLDEITPGFPPTSQIRDWVIKDNSGAIYVADSNQMPFSPSSQDVWRIVRVTGVVKARSVGTSGTQAYIIPTKIEWQGDKHGYDVLPANCTIAVHRTGGPDQLKQHFYIYQNRRLIFLDDTRSWRGSVKLKTSEMDKLQKAFKKANLFALPATVGEPCQNCLSYYIAAVNEQERRPHYVTLYQDSIPDPLGAFIDLVIEYAQKAK